jgi:hypothetical protein
MMKNIDKKGVKSETIQSYLGLLRHGNAHNLEQKMLDKKTYLM